MNPEGSVKQTKSSDVQGNVEANLELARSLSKTAEGIQEKLLGTLTPWNTAEKEKADPEGFVGIVSLGLSTLHSELCHLQDVLKSINAEF